MKISGKTQYYLYQNVPTYLNKDVGTNTFCLCSLINRHLHLKLLRIMIVQLFIYVGLTALL